MTSVTASSTTAIVESQKWLPKLWWQLRAARQQLEASLRRVIRGKDEVLRLALVSIFAKGHLLIEGVPGVGKTTLGQALARAIDCTLSAHPVHQRHAAL